MTTIPLPRPRRRRGVAFFEPKVDEEPKAKSKQGEDIGSSSLNQFQRLLFILPILLLLLLTIYLSTPSSSPQPPYETTTPLTPFLHSLTSLTTLSPALPYTGLATHILFRNLTATGEVPLELMSLVQQVKTLVEEFSGEEELFHQGIVDGLEEFERVEGWNEEGMREGYLGFFEERRGEVGELMMRIEEVRNLSGKLEGKMGEYGRLGNVVEWVEMVFEKAEKRYGDVLGEAVKGKEGVERAEKGWMREEVLEGDKVEIGKYREAERKMVDMLGEIGRECLEGGMEGGGMDGGGVVERKLEAAVMEKKMDWW